MLPHRTHRSHSEASRAPGGSGGLGTYLSVPGTVSGHVFSAWQFLIWGGRVIICSVKRFQTCGQTGHLERCCTKLGLDAVNF